MCKDSPAYAEMFAKVTAAGSEKDRVAAAATLADAIKADGIHCLEGVIAPLQKAAAEKKKDDLKQSASAVVAALYEKVGANVDPYMIDMFPAIMVFTGDKKKPVVKSAEKAITAMATNVNPFATKKLMPLIIAEMHRSKQWPTKVAACEFLKTLAARAPTQVSRCLPDIVPVLGELMWDTRKEVGNVAEEALGLSCKAVGNPDIEPFVPQLIKAIRSPADVPDIVYKLASTTFVQTVEAPALAIMVPVLLRGYREKTIAVKRQCAVIVDNMTKLVDEPHSAEPFLALLVPENEKVMNETSDPECRDCAGKTQQTLMRTRADPNSAAPPTTDEAGVLKALKDLIGSLPQGTEFLQKTLDYVAELCSRLIDTKNFESEEWKSCCEDFLKQFLEGDKPATVTTSYLEKCKKDFVVADVEEVDDEEGVDLCNCEFSLAYGNKILLNNAKLRLKRGRRYGLVGGNFCGKSTLLRSIALGQVDGFPPQEEVTSVYLEADIPNELADLNIIDFVLADPHLSDKPIPEIKAMLTSLDFTDNMMNGCVTALSGGWRMKLALSRAMLRGADFLLLDEPTNHLDYKNVAWVQDYLVNLKGVTVMAVSHDSHFLDEVVQDIIHIDNLKLKKYKGNLAEFIKAKPEAKAYYELKSDKLTFTFPEPGFLEGVKTKSKALIKMKEVGFTYPNTTRKILTGVNIYVSMISRIAVVGPNGAGKSTMIKLLTGELIPDEGDVNKHQSTRVAYVAQHAFHHIEQHLEKSPNQYVQWRYAGGDDKEAIDKATMVLTEDEKTKQAKPLLADGAKRVGEKLINRRQARKTYEYEMKWKDKADTENSWIARDVLEKNGWGKACVRIDEKEANAAAAALRPLTQQFIEKYYSDFGLEAEFAIHNQIAQLSGGQKVKVVLGACMWANPHILILDEPTNYLDRDSLGALAGAIIKFGGGVLLVSHHFDFTSALCSEKWVVDAGRLVAHDAPGEYTTKGTDIVWTPEEERTDGAGNVIKIEQPKKTKLTRKERLAKEKARKQAKELGLEVSSSEED